MANEAGTRRPGSERFTDYALYERFMEIARNRITIRKFDPLYVVPRDHYEMILKAARHSPSGADAQPLHLMVVTNPDTKNKIVDYCANEQNSRAKLKMKFPTPDYRGLRTAPSFIVVASDFRWVRAFPVLPYHVFRTAVA
jgi:5,6-dimethylbenzimidazole synthase